MDNFFGLLVKIPIKISLSLHYKIIMYYKSIGQGFM
jgi:hypothetical protein